MMQVTKIKLFGVYIDVCLRLFILETYWNLW